MLVGRQSSPSPMEESLSISFTAWPNKTSRNLHGRPPKIQNSYVSIIHYSFICNSKILEMT